MRMRIGVSLAAAILTSAAILPAIPAQADETDYLARFEGRWSGSGSMKPTAKAVSVPLGCSANGEPGRSTLSLGGQCSALVLSRNLSADLIFNPATRRYSGVYVTEGDPPAALDGTRVGDALVLAVKWPKPVNGDSDAVMIIRNAGQGHFTFTVRDAAEPGGPLVTTASFTLNREGRAAHAGN
ncbi:hypothetical protein ABLE91_22645 [Aquabacter sp. CN5-332]|uniref:hypothetical protein n=1 Tax=Aquabacter sp. CN5-332 TaxID=3156608 RepID=UPI0032B428A9